MYLCHWPPALSGTPGPLRNGTSGQEGGCTFEAASQAGLELIRSFSSEASVVAKSQPMCKNPMKSCMAAAVATDWFHSCYMAQALIRNIMHNCDSVHNTARDSPACKACIRRLVRYLHALAPGNLVQGCFSALIFQEGSHQLQDQRHLDAKRSHPRPVKVVTC